ncbi:helix-turn-helix transcriptional regulator [Burkholderia vietnamiensis]|uniref:helix-turn-helix transcriptional regulator n=1 Tax=Burkholderia vietnamiensis TaxID=60552 RepID=UPI001CF51393|nr:AlpA family phage regulatory protein [Burkholderia vietnamiensis]MCA8144453.1 AlpA family phage regulatory protein [Burkholderia vietnamiensis]
MKSQPPARILRPSDVAARLGIGRSTLYELVAEDPNFPPRKQVTPRAVGWLESDINAYILALPNAV